MLVQIWGKALTKIAISVIAFGLLAWSIVQIDDLRERVPGVAAFIEQNWAKFIGTRNVSRSAEICDGQIRTVNDGQVRAANFQDHWVYSRTIRVESYSRSLIGIRFEARSRPNADLKIFLAARHASEISPFDDFGQLIPEGIYVFVYKPREFLKLIIVAHKPELVDVTPMWKCEENVIR